MTHNFNCLPPPPSGKFTPLESYEEKLLEDLLLNLAVDADGH